MRRTDMQLNNSETGILRRFLRDPVFHFLIAGSIVYAVAFVLSDPVETAEGDDTKIIVSIGEQTWLKSQWESRWQRPPTEQELNGLISQYVRETVLYREAIALGLDKDDVVIRRRLGQKLEFLSQDLLEPQAPSKDDLKEYFESNKDRYKRDDQITITQLFFDPDARGNATLDDAREALETLVTLPMDSADVTGFGDPIQLQAYHPSNTLSELARLFGIGFAEPLFTLEPGRWHGPVLSGYGTHLVYVHDIWIAPDPVFEDVAGRVAEDWVSDKRAELNEKFVEALLEKYTVVVEEATAQSDQSEKVLN